MIGRIISHYRITDKLGEGGMGVVYKAQDTKLERAVALKFLAAHLVSDQEIRKRFEREAKAAAALNHPNICTVHEIDEVEGKTFIAMAFIEGDSLEPKIEAGPLKLNDALDIAIQTAQGLQAAHEKKIVHRDIKPANLMVTPAGSKQQITIMDFGLALLTDRSKLTRMDETMGTVTYMSPEQTYGMDLDHRTDIWSLGVVLYEMVTGQQPFKGHYDKAVMYSITNEEPEPMTALRTGVPMELELLVNKCLAKDANRRYQSTVDMVVDLDTLSDKLKSGKSTILRAQTAGDVGARHAVPAAPGETTGTRAQHAVPLHSAGPLARYRVIEDAEESDGSIKYVAEDTELHRSVAIRVLSQSSEQQFERRQRLQRRAVLGMGALLAASLALWALLWFRGTSSDAPQQPVRFSFTPENLETYTPESILTSGSASAVVSPDGRHIVFVTQENGEKALWVRDLGRETPRKLEGTEEAEDPFWSPDSQSIGFGTETELKRIPLSGGEPIALCELPQNRAAFAGGSWSPDGEQIVYSAYFQLFQVPSRGGTPKFLFERDEAESGILFVFPRFLPETEGSRGLVYTSGSVGGFKLGVLDLRTGERRELVPGARAVYSASGHLVYGDSASPDSGFRALPFSLETLTTTGDAFPIVGAGFSASVAQDGTLVYTNRSGARQQLVWRSRSGERLAAIGQPQDEITHASLSPDGLHVAVLGAESDKVDIWVHNIARGNKTRITFSPGVNIHPTWARSGRQIAYSLVREGHTDIFQTSADGSGEDTQLTDEPLEEFAPDWSDDGKYLIYHTRGNLKKQRDIRYREFQEGGGTSAPVEFVATPFNERTATFSPDGRLVAYLSDQSGQYEVYVRPFPEGDRVDKVSLNGGDQPRWSRDGRELFYVERTTLMAVSVRTSGSFTVGPPEPLFAHPGLLNTGSNREPRYDVSADGQKFVLPERLEGEAGKPPTIHVVQNWFAEFKDQQTEP